MSITLSNLDLCGHNTITQLLSSSFSISHLVLDFGYRLSIDLLVVLRCIVEAMATNSSVKSLELKRSSLRPPVLSGNGPGPALSEILQRNTTLETLRFRHCPIGPYVSSIAEGLMHSTTLKELVLQDDSITDIGGKSIADLLVNNTTLEILDITYNYIITEGVGHIAESRKGNSTLHVLRLDEFAMCRNAEPLAVALSVNTTLERLEIVQARRRRWVPRDVTEKLMSNGVLQQLLTIAIERTVSAFGGEETGRALMTILEEWRTS